MYNIPRIKNTNAYSMNYSLKKYKNYADEQSMHPMDFKALHDTILTDHTVPRLFISSTAGN